MKKRILVGLLVVMPLVARAASVVKIDGSSTVFPITEAVAEEFQKTKKGTVRVTVGISGTGGGFKKFCRGEIDIADASRPIMREEMAGCYQQGVKYMELPIAYDALTVVVHLQNTWAATMTVAELEKIWAPEAQGKVIQWNQVNSTWPDQPLRLYGAGSDSGTFDYFTEAIVGKLKSSRGDYSASEDDNVLVQGVANDKNALGYFGYAYFAENQGRLKAVAINSGRGGVLPSTKTVLDGSYHPLSRPIFLYVSAKAVKKPEVKEFVSFYLNQAAKLVREVKYIPLSAEDYRAVQARLEAKKLGTAFGGKPEVGLKVAEILKREPRL